MSTETWIGEPDLLGNYEKAADWSGGVAPVAGDTVLINGVSFAGITHLGPLIEFTLGETISVNFFPHFNLNQHDEDPRKLPGFTITGQTMDITGDAGPALLWFQNDDLVNDSISIAGTAVFEVNFNDTIDSHVQIGGPATPSLLQVQIEGTDVFNASVSHYVPTTAFEDGVTIAGGSTLQLEGIVSNGLPPANVSNTNIFDLQAGGTFMADDAQEAPNISDSDHNMIFINTGTFLETGAAGAITSARFHTNIDGGGTIIVNGNGAPASDTTLEFDGNVTKQNIYLTDATMTVKDFGYAVADPTTISGFNVSGGGLTFLGGSTLVLYQPVLTVQEFNNNDTGFTQVSDGQHPFTTPITGFDATDAIELEDHYDPVFNFYTTWNSATGILSIDRETDQPTNPAIVATFSLVGAYNAADFVLTGDAHTGLLTLTYNPH